MAKRQRCVLRGIVLALFFCLGFSALGEDVKIRVENGVTIVCNPKIAAPLPGTRTKLVLKEGLAKGRFIARVALPTRSCVWKKGWLYTIEEDEEGYRSIKVYKSAWE